MLKARRKETSEQLRFPDAREGLPEDPHPFVGSHHLVAAAAVQEHLSTRCLVAVVGPAGSGKSTVCRRAANSRWARQWFLRDEAGHPVHRRFWVDLEDCRPGREVGERVAHALSRRSLASALSRLGDGRPCLLVLDNADQALAGGDGTLATLAGMVDRGATVIAGVRSTDGLDAGRAWTDVVEVSGFVSDDEAMDLFARRAPLHATDPRVPQLVAACSRLPLAVSVLAGAAAIGDLDSAEGAASAQRGVHGLAFVLPVAAAMLDDEDRLAWGALSLLPSGVDKDDVAAMIGAVADAERRVIQLHAAGIADRCEAGIRIPLPLRLGEDVAGLDEAAVRALWAAYARRAVAVVGSASRPENQNALAPGRADAPPRGATPGPRGASGASRPAPPTAGERWLTRQVATLAALSLRPTLPPNAFELACAGLLAHRSGVELDTLDSVLLRFVEPFLLPAEVAAQGQAAMADGSGQGAADHRANILQAAHVAAVLEDQRRFAAAVEVAGQVVIAAGADGDALITAAALCRLGRAERLAAQHALAGNHLSQALGLYEACDDGVGRGSVLFELGQIDLELGRLDDAEEKLDSARSCFARAGRPLGEANANLDLVRIDLARGRVDEAERRLAEAMDRYQQAGDALGFANSCLQLGQVELARGRLDSAERRFRLALDNFEKATDRVGFAHACLQLGQVESGRGRLEHAERRFRGALAGYTAVDDKVGLANASLQLGQIDLAWGRLEQAAQRLRQALAGYESLGDQIGLAHASLQLGQVELGHGRLDDAKVLVDRARGFYDGAGDAGGSANSRQVAALICQAQGDTSEALYFFGEAARLYDALERTATAGWSLAGAARICTGRAERQGYAASAVRHLEAAGLPDAAARLAGELAELDRQRAAEVSPETFPGEGPGDEAFRSGGRWGEGPTSLWPRPVPEAPTGTPGLPDDPVVDPGAHRQPTGPAAAAAVGALLSATWGPPPPAEAGEEIRPTASAGSPPEPGETPAGGHQFEEGAPLIPRGEPRAGEPVDEVRPGEPIDEAWAGGYEAAGPEPSRRRLWGRRPR